MDTDANESHDATSGFTRQRSEYNASNTAGISQTGNDAILNSLLKHIRTTDERSVKMASQIDQLNRALATVLELGVLGANPVTPAQTPPVAPAQPPPVFPPPPQFRTRRNGPPGTFRASVPDTQHKPLEKTRFYVSSCLSDKFRID